MLPGLQYTDFHKFLVSIGGLLALTGVGLPIFLLKSQSALLLTEQQLKQATPAAQEAMRAQQGQLALLISVWPWVTVGLLIIGFLLVFLGAKSWKRQQQRIETREEVEIIKIRAEGEKATQETLDLVRARQASPEEVAENQAAETAEEEVAAEAGEEQEAAVDSSESAKPSTEADAVNEPPSAVSNPAAIYAKVEDRLIGQLSAGLGRFGEWVRDVRLDNSIVDAVFVSRSPNVPNLLVDLKLIRPRSLSRNARSMTEQVVGRAVSVSAKAEREFNATFTTLVIFAVVPDDMPYDLDSFLGSSVDLHTSLDILEKHAGSFADLNIPVVGIVSRPDRLPVAWLAQVLGRATRGFWLMVAGSHD